MVNENSAERAQILEVNKDNLPDTKEADSRETSSGWSVRRISLILTIIALLLWSFSITQAKLNIGNLGLLSSFPITFFIAIGILTIASAILWTSRENHSKLLLVQLCLLVASIFIIPTIIGGAIPVQPTVYNDQSYIDYITRTGHIDQSFGEHDWPIPWITWSSSFQILGFNIRHFTAIIPWIPFMWQLLFFFPVFVFLRNTIGKIKPNYVWAGMWLFYLWHWTETSQTGAESFGPFFFFSFLALLSTAIARNDRALTFGMRVTAIILLGVIAATQLITSLIVLLTIAALYFSKRLTSSKLMLVSAVFIIAWSMYGSAMYFDGNLPNWLDKAFRIGSAASAQLGFLGGNPEHATIALIRIIFSGILAGVAVIGVFLTWIRRNNNINDTTVLAIIVGSAIIGIIVGAGYGHELYQRLFFFLLPAGVYFAVRLLHSKVAAVMLCALLIIMLPVAVIAKYGNQKLDHLSPAYYSATAFLYDNSSHGSVTGISRLKNLENYDYWYTYEKLEWQNDKLVYDGGRYDLTTHYISIDDHNRQLYTYFFDEPQFYDDTSISVANATNCNLVFTNNDYSLYIHER
jgi:hypothetical protein